MKPIRGFKDGEQDYSLWLAWLVTIFWILFYAKTFNHFLKFVEIVLNLWNEVEAQHEHID